MKTKCVTIAVVLALLCGCASTKDGKIRTSANGDSSASIRTGVITTITAPDGTVTETCGTPQAPCEETASVGGDGSADAWAAVWEAIKTIGVVAALAF